MRRCSVRRKTLICLATFRVLSSRSSTYFATFVGKLLKRMVSRLTQTVCVGELIAEDAEYGGIRIIVPGHFFQNAKVSIQIDIGFGDKIIPGPTPVTLKPILDFPAPQMNGYSRESAISEKFDARVK